MVKHFLDEFCVEILNRLMKFKTKKMDFVEKWECLKQTEEWKVGFIPSDITDLAFNFPVNDISFF